MTDIVFADSASAPIAMVAKRLNRHGLITGATGTGKTVTLQNLAENMAKSGIPVFMTDVKGDLSGIAVPKQGTMAAPSIFWDLMGKAGHPVRTTISEFGPILLGQLMDLSDVQRGVLELVFKVADDSGLLLIDLKDLQSVLQFVSDNAKDISAKYGLVSTTTIAAIQRGLLSLENEGASQFFGEPAIDLNDLLAVDAQGRGHMNILMANELIQRPRLYACFLLWLLAELFEDLPEVGDLPQPKLVLFFDEAHLLFDNAPKVLLEKVEQVVRLIRSKGVGVYFVTQNPGDIPEEIQGQLGNRIQHALRAFTPTELKKVKAAADSLRANPAFDTVKTLGELGVGEALVSTLDEKGIPAIVERAKVRLPESRLGPLQPMERTQLMMASPYGAKYGMVVDRQSAYETLQTQKAANNNADRVPVMKKTGRPRDSMAEAIAKSAVRAASSSIGRQIGNQIIRGVLGAILKR